MRQPDLALESISDAVWNNRGVFRLALGQRIVIVVALGFALAIVGAYVTTLGSSPTQFGWFGYAPLTKTAFPLDQLDLTPWEQLLVWLGFTGLWAGASLVLLRPPPRQSD